MRTLSLALLLLALPLPADDKPPDASAPLATLVEYWVGGVLFQRPTAAVSERLLETIDSDPESAAALVWYFPVRENVCTRLEPLSGNPRVAKWMRLKCASRRKELVAAAERGEPDELTQLSIVDWPAARPIVTRLADSPESRAVALALLYEHAATGARRAELLQALSQDVSRQALRPFMDVVERHPDQLIPEMTRLLGDENRNVRTLAANALSQFHLHLARADALRPLLRWLSEPDWARDESLGRLRLIQTVVRLDMREAIPHLRHVIAHDPDETIRAYAARALADFGVASPRLR